MEEIKDDTIPKIKIFKRFKSLVQFMQGENVIVVSKNKLRELFKKIVKK
jgi:hypothetical protein